ncbi:MAG: hypothetical protein JF609_07580 [Verrucomicrobia bacterium]|nr:hypothetical protein [Verrucomicrobiota bacterium]
MKTRIKNSARFLSLALALSAVVLFGCRCSTSKPTPDPLAGWTFRTFDQFEPPSGQHHYHLDKTISDDYQDFIAKNKLSLVGAITGFYEDMTGQHAVRFEAIPPDAYSSWTYVLIYDKQNHRVKIIKYDEHRYRS